MGEYTGEALGLLCDATCILGCTIGCFGDSTFPIMDGVAIATSLTAQDEV